MERFTIWLYRQPYRHGGGDTKLKNKDRKSGIWKEGKNFLSGFSTDYGVFYDDSQVCAHIHQCFTGLVVLNVLNLWEMGMHTRSVYSRIIESYNIMPHSFKYFRASAVLSDQDIV